MAGRRSGQTMALRWRWQAVRLQLIPAAQAQDFFSQLFGGFGRPRSWQPLIQVPFATTEGSRDAAGRAAALQRLWRRPGLLRAHLRRTLFPDYRRPTTRAGRRPAAVSARRARPRWSMAAISTTPRPRTENPIPNCRTRSATATRSSRAAPATARTRSGLALGQDRGRPDACARATSSPANTAWSLRAGAPTGAAPR